jgi:hypothetical protein
VKKNSGQSVPASLYTLIELDHLPAIKLTATIKQKYRGKWNQQYTTRIADKFTMTIDKEPCGEISCIRL